MAEEKQKIKVPRGDAFAWGDADIDARAIVTNVLIDEVEVFLSDRSKLLTDCYLAERIEDD